MSEIRYTHVMFEGGYPRVSTWVPLADAPAYYIANQTHHIERVRCILESGETIESFGKQWMTWTGKTWELAGIGAGCYSGMNVIRYHDVIARHVPEHLR